MAASRSTLLGDEGTGVKVGRRPGVGLIMTGLAAAMLAVTLAACTSHPSAGGAGSSVPVTGTRTVIVGTSTVTSTNYVTDGTRTVAPVPSSAGPATSTTGTATASTTGAATGTAGAATGTAGGTSTSRGSSTATVTGTSTSLPAAQIGDCPYISAADVMSFSGEHYGPTSIIPVKPYPICIFTRSDGGYLATTRIVEAATPAAAAAVVDSFVPVDQSFPVNAPAGWSGGAMALPKTDKVGNNSIYAVSKGKIAIIAESNQGQSIKGRQMVEQIVKNMGW